ncbi:hypothetical protein [Halorientalis regularis]|uniref:hypothetical protein n=1 Tax=Halorientalis regularis TaxID=660518 RepID=UPI0011142EF7|nr:hypothetical protein [Halorientalis regularis]
MSREAHRQAACRQLKRMFADYHLEDSESRSFPEINEEALEAKVSEIESELRAELHRQGNSTEAEQ